MMPTEAVPIQAANMNEPWSLIKSLEAAPRFETSESFLCSPLAPNDKSWNCTEEAIISYIYLYLIIILKM